MDSLDDSMDEEALLQFVRNSEAELKRLKDTSKESDQEISGLEEKLFSLETEKQKTLEGIAEIKGLERSLHKNFEAFKGETDEVLRKYTNLQRQYVDNRSEDGDLEENIREMENQVMDYCD